MTNHCHANNNENDNKLVIYFLGFTPLILTF